MNKEINVLALVKGEERYVFCMTTITVPKHWPMLGRFAADPQLSFSWYDAALLSKKIREMAAADAAEQNSCRSTVGPPTNPRHNHVLLSDTNKT